MPKPTEATVVRWRELAEEGHLYAEIARMYPDFSIAQVRHYCVGNTGRHLPGPIQQVDRWYGTNPWMRGHHASHSKLTVQQAHRILDDWDEVTGQWKTSGPAWARKLGVSPGTIYMLRRGETWKHLQHPNQGRKPR